MTRSLLVALVLLLAVSADAREYVRSGRVHRAFLRSSGYPHGRPGYVADHQRPLCAGGSDSVVNLHWQLIAEAQVKDRAEWTLCRRLRALVAQFDQQWRVTP